MAFCNKDRLIADDTKQFELRRERFEGENLKPDQEALADDLETEQVNLYTKLSNTFGLRWTLLYNLNLNNISTFY